ncbi:hypothetical protein BAUCODRAFT_425138 [Baudoinia panamericana UAMH 10762]|uniref:SURF1-like protein n=1 Tax=Baudoinia panamericana (strain UAMH 10762) TaxID=717646 RepID=M2MNZ0_BAUPA|nr:uncharacterized protein BAUCODRAFT_425138 [Baudoinia panamericana UAMH 10762]EMC98416.1 hypothetical protein BAUCODRAFT_425138 [Baudoinia panamericana UAMH 10762]
MEPLSRLVVRQLSRSLQRAPLPIPPRRQWICTHCLQHLSKQIQRPSSTIRTRLRQQPRPSLRHTQRRPQSTQPPNNNPADIDPNFRSILDNPPTLIRSNRRHNTIGLLLLASIPLTAFVLGCWQVHRLTWKTDLIAKFEDRLVREPLPLPPVIDPDAIAEFDYRRVVARGKFLHGKEMLVGPRVREGEDGYLVITPLDRSEEFPDLAAKGINTTILVNRGWISRSHAAQSSRQQGLPASTVVVSGLLRTPWQKNSFTPANNPAQNTWHFPDVAEMAAHAGSQAVWVEETMRPDLITAYERQAAGAPIGRPAEVNLRNNHLQYIFTWFSLSAATSVMLWMVVKGRRGGGGGGVRRSSGW